MYRPCQMQLGNVHCTLYRPCKLQPGTDHVSYSLVLYVQTMTDTAYYWVHTYVMFSLLYGTQSLVQSTGIFFSNSANLVLCTFTLIPYPPPQLPVWKTLSFKSSLFWTNVKFFLQAPCQNEFSTACIYMYCSTVAVRFLSVEPTTVLSVVTCSACHWLYGWGGG